MRTQMGGILRASIPPLKAIEIWQKLAVHSEEINSNFFQCVLCELPALHNYFRDVIAVV